MSEFGDLLRSAGLREIEIAVYTLKGCGVSEIVGKKLINVTADSEGLELFFEDDYAIEFNTASGKLSFGKMEFAEA